MSKLITIALIAAFVLSSNVVTFAQKRKASIEPEDRIVKDVFVSVKGVEAFTDGSGALVRWQTLSETSNLGFYVYRIGQKGRVLASEQLIPGAGMKAGSDPANGDKYEFFDSSGGLGSAYVIECVSLDGRRYSTSAVSAAYTVNLKSATGRSAADFDDQKKTATGNIEKSRLFLPKDLYAQTTEALSSPDPTNQRWVASQPGAKIAVRQDGLYHVTRAELQNTGFDVTTDPSYWRLFTDGNEQPINIGGNGDYVEFYGTGIDTVESDTRAYYLITGNITGKRMRSRVSRPVGSQTISPNYQQSFVKKERTYYYYNLLNGDLDNYFGRTISPTPTTMTFTVSGIDFNKAKFTFILKLQGYNVGSHVVDLVLNGHSIGTVAGNGMVPFSQTFSLPTSYLVEGSNSLVMTSIGSSNDYSFFDTLNVNFARMQLTDQNRLSFYTDNYRGATITGFTSPNIRVFETTKSDDPVEVTNLRVNQNGSQYSVVLPAYRGAVMYAVENSAILQSPSVTRNNPSTLATTTHNANLIIISYADFITQAQAWANYRRSQGFTVEVVDVADIYDEFNYGVLSSNSINSFLHYARDNWQTAPGYVLLIGDATYDPRNYEGTGYNDLVPTKMVDTVYLTTGSDEALADFNGDGLAEMAIGRIPARTPDVVTNALAKVMRFETPTLQSLNRGAVFAFDAPIGYDFGAMSQQLRSELPASMPATMVSRAYLPGDPNYDPNDPTRPDPAAPGNLMNALNTGKYIVNYSGHGSAGGWTSSGFFNNGNIVCSPGPNCISNTNNESIYTLLTCLNGYFILLTADSLSENLLKTQTGGAVAVWASTGETTPDIQLIMGQRFNNQLSAGTITRMGDLIRDAKSVIPAGTDVRFSWALMGDPMLKVR